MRVDRVRLEGFRNYDRLEAALGKNRDQMGACSPIPAPPLPERALSLRQALFGETEVLALEQCEGRIAACQLAPYPPGVPVVAPGERITKKELSYLKKIGYNKQEVPVILEMERQPGNSGRTR